MTRNSSKGLTVAELLVVLAVLGFLAAGVLAAFNSYRRGQALSKTTEAIVETLRQARSQTMSSKDGLSYGVHFATTSIVLFPGTAYSQLNSSNVSYPLDPASVAVALSLSGGGSDVVFQRLTGETSQHGTVVVTAAGTTASKTITIYKTGIVDWD